MDRLIDGKNPYQGTRSAVTVTCWNGCVSVCHCLSCGLKPDTATLMPECNFGLDGADPANDDGCRCKFQRTRLIDSHSAYNLGCSASELDSASSCGMK
jgi:hypothetical protein